MGRNADETVHARGTSTLVPRLAVPSRTPCHRWALLAGGLALAAMMASGTAFAANSVAEEPQLASTTKANLDQARNGRASAPRSPVEFQNGNAGPSNSHFVEGQSMPYRLVFSGLTLGTHIVTIGWDITAQGRHAFDYITSVNRLQPHDLFSPPHAAETVNPLVGLSGFGPPMMFPIPAPSSAGSPSPGQPASSFNALPSSERALTMYNGVITAASYVSQGSLTESKSETRLRITFTANTPDVVLAWGGHIASRADWGAGNSASDINGSPYHTRLIDLDGKGGNQDRSMQASAILAPLACAIAGPATACPGGINVYSSSVPAGSYLWTVSGDATIVGAANQPTVQVLAKTGCKGGDYTVSLRLSGADACASTCSQKVTFQDVIPPVLACPPDLTIECGASIDPKDIGFATATDACTPNVTVTFGDASAAPAFAAATCVPRPPIQRTWTATDACGNVTTCVQTISFVDTKPPALSCPADVVVECGASFDPAQTGMATATDECDANVTVTFGDASAAMAPVFSAASCTPRPPIQRTWTATDDCGNVTTCVQTISFVDSKPPVLTCPNLDMTVECGQPYDPGTIGAATATDDCDPNVTVTFGDASAAMATAFSTSSCEGRPPITRTWTATDDCGNSITCVQTIRFVDSKPPVITCPPLDVVVECGQPYDPASIGAATAKDDCDPNVTVTFGDASAAMARVFSTSSCEARPPITRTWTATDDCGNATTCVQTITFKDTQPPVLTCPNLDMTVECGQPYDPGTIGAATATDDCDPNVTVTFGDASAALASGPTTMTCEARPPVTRTWTATDDCGNSITCVQTIRFVDTTPPAITCPPQIVRPLCDNVVTWEADAKDGCDASPKVTFVPPSGSAFPPGKTLVTGTAVDGCGNSATCSFEVVVTGPTITGPSTICKGNKAELCGPDDAVSFAWTGPGGFSAAERCVDVTAAGRYELVVTFPGGACATKIGHLLALADPPVCSITGPEHPCSGGPVNLCGPEGQLNYDWTGPGDFKAETRCVAVSIGGDYHLTITDQNLGCTSNCSYKLELVTCEPGSVAADEPSTLRRKGVSTVDVKAPSDPLPTTLELRRPSPNPFTSATRIAYDVPEGGREAVVAIYDVAGRNVRTLASGPSAPGRHEVTWNGRDEQGNKVTSGVYFVRIVSGGKARTLPVVYLGR